MKFLKAVILAFGRVIHRISPKLSKKLQLAYPFFRQKVAGLAVLKTKTPRVALLSSAGLYLEGEAPFDYKSLYGDASFRVIRSDFPLSSLRLTESDLDRTGFEADPASLFPLPELKTVAAEFGGEAALHHFSLLGFNLKRKELLEETAPALLKILREDKTDLVFLTPACVVCHEVLPQVAGALEKEGIATVTFAFIPRALEAARGPRTVLFGGDCGLPFGKAAVETRKELLRLAIRAAYEMKTAGEVWKFSFGAKVETTVTNAAAIR
ncbi:MAG: hypothetical protein L0196_10765 [candidate division Zixibacteria bacterium]|nr:hypothetical protein [candidate division Zixibacteria bacterium]